MKLSRDEFIELAMRELDAVNRVAHSLANSAWEADDLTQETFLRALRAYEQFTLHDFGIRAWLLRILHNHYFNYAKREKRQPAAMVSEALDAEAAAPSPESNEIAREAVAFDDAELNAALEQLSPDLRTILIMWGVDELSYKELSHVLDIPMGTVMSRLHRARHRLHELMPHRRGKKPPAGGE